MPTQSEHEAIAAHNELVLRHLLAQDLRFLSSWATTIAFYRALHLVNALLQGDPKSPGRNPPAHTTRNEWIRREPRYHGFAVVYDMLYRASRVARYEKTCPGDFNAVFPLRTVERAFAGSYQRQLEREIASLLDGDDFLRRVNSPLTPPSR
ncbi:MAG TPA: hypothetical protein VGE52_06875 [Pirellulales bacterium]